MSQDLGQKATKQPSKGRIDRALLKKVFTDNFINCPKCHSQDLDYNGDFVNGSTAQAEPTCRNCGCNFVVRADLTNLQYEVKK